MKVRKKSYLIPLISALILGGLLAISIVTYLYRTRQLSALIIHEDVQKIVRALEDIDDDCTIIGFDYQQNRINFLNTVSFTGSEVGPMNLEHPENWKGPYLEDNPTMQKKSYMVVKTNKGFFVTPGPGVKLPNGKVISEDIILDQDADIPVLMKDSNGLLWNSRALAAPLDLKKFRVENIEPFGQL